jgi:outer membrane protein TolC
MTTNLRLITLFLLLTPAAFGQMRTAMSLQEGYDLLAENYPELKNAAIENEALTLSLDQLRRDRLPSIDFSTEGRYQSQSVQLQTEGTNLPFKIDQPLYSVKSYVEARYLLWDGGMNAAQRKLKQAQSAADQQQIEVSRYGLQQRINQLFIGILLLREQKQLFSLSLADLEARKAILQAGVQQGVVLPGELTQLEVQGLELASQQSDLAYQESGLIATLSQLTGTPLAEDVILTLPDLPEPARVPDLSRPEQNLFGRQREAILAQVDVIKAMRQPKLSLFAQGGAGVPNPLNLLDSGFAPYGLIGAGFSWKLIDWKKAKTDRELLALQAQKVSNLEETFDFNVESQTANYLAAVRRLRTQIENDREIARLQAEILQQAAAQLDQGVLTANEYVTRVNAELRARQTLALHKIELLQTQLDFWNQRGSL